MHQLFQAFIVTQKPCFSSLKECFRFLHEPLTHQEERIQFPPVCFVEFVHGWIHQAPKADAKEAVGHVAWMMEAGEGGAGS